MKGKRQRLSEREREKWRNQMNENEEEEDDERKERGQYSWGWTRPSREQWGFNSFTFKSLLPLFLFFLFFPSFPSFSFFPLFLSIFLIHSFCQFITLQSALLDDYFTHSIKFLPTFLSLTFSPTFSQPTFSQPTLLFTTSNWIDFKLKSSTTTINLIDIPIQ